VMYDAFDDRAEFTCRRHGSIAYGRSPAGRSLVVAAAGSDFRRRRKWRLD
jgi:hypothetical protein